MDNKVDSKAIRAAEEFHRELLKLPDKVSDEQKLRIVKGVIGNLVSNIINNTAALMKIYTELLCKIDEHISDDIDSEAEARINETVDKMNESFIKPFDYCFDAATELYNVYRDENLDEWDAWIKNLNDMKEQVRAQVLNIKEQWSLK